MNIATPTRQSARQNHLLAALPATEFAALLPQLELVPMPLGLVIYESGDVQGYVYFPTTSVVSLIRVLADGQAAGSALVGSEGAVGVASFMGGESTPDRATVLSAGYAYRIRASALRNEFHRSGELRNLLLRFMQVLITRTMQTAVCIRYHSVEQQLCRFLLSLLERLPSRELTMTQELIANMLGVRREGITAAAGRLQAAGVIRYRRGHISVTDRLKLEARACECYGVVKREYDRLLPGYLQGTTAPALELARANESALPLHFAIPTPRQADGIPTEPRPRPRQHRAAQGLTPSRRTRLDSNGFPPCARSAARPA